MPLPVIISKPSTIQSVGHGPGCNSHLTKNHSGLTQKGYAVCFGCGQTDTNHPQMFKIVSEALHCPSCDHNSQKYPWPKKK